mmetsp:Transcript_65316/g.154314  ORF Transcript_65316/g.154314 Transcript_65316/m.154314 type:complete len:311 (-) Transcript_65316:1413-2345(-)
MRWRIIEQALSGCRVGTAWFGWRCERRVPAIASVGVVQPRRHAAAGFDLQPVDALVDRQLHEGIGLEPIAQRGGHAGAQIGEGRARIRLVGIGARLAAFAAQVELQLRHHRAAAHIAQAQAQVEAGSGFEIVLAVERQLQQGLGEVVDVAGQAAEAVGAEQQVGGAGAGLQAAVQRLAGLGAGREVHGAAAGGQLEPELQAPAAVGREALVAGQQAYIAQAGRARRGQLGIALGHRAMAAQHIGQLQRKAPVGRDAVVQRERGDVVGGVALDFLLGREADAAPVHAAGAAAQLVLVEVIVPQVEAQAGGR